jgi:excinuclease ABC subunit A
VLTVVTGVSGSGKSTLIKKILFPAMQKLDNAGEKAGQFSEMTGSFHI